MSNIVSVTDFRNNIADVLNRVRYRNETIYLIRGKTLVAKVSKVDDYLPARVSSRKQANISTGFLAATKVVLGKEFGRFKEFGGWISRKLVKNLLGSLKLVSFKLRRWVKFCFAFQKNWG